MTQKLDDPKVMIQYLLGKVSAEEQDQLEQSFDNDEVFEQLLVVEDNLIDDYVRDKLPKHERELFERNFLTSSRRREKVELARALMQYISKLPEAELPKPVVTNPASVSWSQSLRTFLHPQALRWRLAFALQVASAAIIALLVGWIATLPLKRHVADLQAPVSELRQMNEALQAQVSNASALEAQVAQLQQSQAEVLGSSPQIMHAFYDGGRLVTLDKQGNLAGLESLPPRFQQTVKMALVSERVETPDLRALGGKTQKLMGGAIEGDAFALLSPVGIVVETNQPTFRWEPLKGATSYTVTISDSNYNEVLASQPLVGTEWIAQRPLERGKVYLWQVTALKEGKEVKSPKAPGSMARFQVLEQAKADELAQVKRGYPNSHLTLGILYAQAGLLDDAEREFKALLAANPKSGVAQRLLRSVKAKRRTTDEDR